MAPEWVVLYLAEPVWGEQCAPPSGTDCRWGLRLLWYYHIHSQIHTHKKKKKNTVTPRPGCAMNINGGSSFWAHSTKQTVRNVHAWLRSTWPTPYIQFNGIMNTQYKGIVHDTKLLCTMQDLCHWFLLLQGAIFLVAVSSGVSVTFQQVTLTVVWIIPVIKTEMALTQDRKMAAMCEILWVNIFLH